MEHTKNYFELFTLPVNYDIDLSDLNSHFRTLQKAVHPDNFANSAEQERLYSVQQASLINDAYNTLKDPLERAKYMLVLNEIDINADDIKKLPPEFLMQQIELREQIEHAQDSKDIDLLDSVSEQILNLFKEKTSAISELFAQNDVDLESVAKRAQEAQFFSRMKESVDTIILDLED